MAQLYNNNLGDVVAPWLSR